MKLIWKLLILLACAFGAVVSVYWFNLDTKLVKAIEPFMTAHYDSLERDRRL